MSASPATSVPERQGGRERRPRALHVRSPRRDCGSQGWSSHARSQEKMSRVASSTSPTIRSRSWVPCMARLMRSMDCRNHRCARCCASARLRSRDVPPDAPIAQEATGLRRRPGTRTTDTWRVPPSAVGRASSKSRNGRCAASVARCRRQASSSGSRYGTSQRVLPISEPGAGTLTQGRGEILPREAMLGVGLPVHVEGQLHQRAKALLARLQRLLQALALAEVPGVRLLRHAVARHGSPAARP